MDGRCVCPFQICDTRESIRYILTNCAKEVIKPACSNIVGLGKIVFSDYIIDVLPQRFWILWIFINNIFIILLFCAFYNVIDIDRYSFHSKSLFEFTAFPWIKSRRYISFFIFLFFISNIFIQGMTNQLQTVLPWSPVLKKHSIFTMCMQNNSFHIIMIYTVIW